MARKPEKLVGHYFVLDNPAVDVAATIRNPSRLIEPYWHLWFDGGFRDGVGVWAWRILDRDEEIACGSGQVIHPRPTVNLSEYCGLGFGLRYVLERGDSSGLKIHGDSLMVINQLIGRWRVRGDLVGCRWRCWELLTAIAMPWSAVWRPREMNKECDAMATAAYPATREK